MTSSTAKGKKTTQVSGKNIKNTGMEQVAREIVRLAAAARGRGGWIHELITRTSHCDHEKTKVVVTTLLSPYRACRKRCCA